MKRQIVPFERWRKGLTASGAILAFIARKTDDCYAAIVASTP
jgi:hypothetical protein